MRRSEGKNRNRHMIGWMILGTLLAAGWATPAGAAAGEDENLHLWKPRVRSVSVFKNGLGFFLREGEVQLREGWCVSRHIPPAALGTLAIFAHDKKQVVDIVGSGPGEVVDFDGQDTPDTAAARRGRLLTCRHLKVQLTYGKDNGKRTAAGKLRSVGPKFVVLEAKASNFAVPLAEITRLQVLELPIRAHVMGKDGKAPAQAKLGMAYLRKGITWIPEYTLEVLDENTALLTLRGTLVNQAEDLVHCDVNFIVGVPHFVHTKYLAPIAVGQVIRTIGAAVAPQQIRSQIMNRAAVVSNIRTAPQFNVVERPVAAGGGNLRSALGNVPSLAGPGGADYTVYTKKDLTVRRGEKAIVTLFTRRISYSHLYRWSPPARMKHLYVLHNSTDTAWTTGPCLIVSDGRPLSEDLLKYTPVKGNAEIPVTAAINVAHERTETEIARKLKSYSPSHDFYVDLVTLKGKLLVKNFEKRPALIVILVKAPGKPTEADHGGLTSADPTKLKLLNRSGTVRYEIKLAPGETKTLTYVYERYVPSR